MAMRVLLVYMPFGGAERPALGISLLKAAAERRGFVCDIAYFNIVFAEMIGWAEYGRLSNSLLPIDGDSYPYTTLAGEWLFSQAFHGPGSLDARAYVDEVLRKRPHCVSETAIRKLLQLRAVIPPFLCECRRRVDWRSYDLVGFSSTFDQNFASLCLARWIKEARPSVRVAFGGANWEAAMGEELFRRFSFVDFASLGEADESFPQLLDALNSGVTPGHVKGIAWRDEHGRAVSNGAPDLVRNLDDLPEPDFSDFFEQFRQSTIADAVDPWLQLETSRGCWWGQKQHCTFCGLNGTTMTYRRKSPERAVQEIVDQSQGWGVRNIAFTDNILDMGYLTSVLPKLAEQQPDLRIFYETKSNLKKAQVRTLAWAGVRDVQSGIESLSSSVLRLMRKGVSALQNVAFLKWCRQFGIQAQWNILYGFPGEDAADYEQTLEVVRRIVQLAPPTAIGRIRLDRFSPHYVQAEHYGFRRVRSLTAYTYIYPFAEKSLSRLCYFFDYEYADDRNPLHYVTPLLRFCRRWRAAVRHHEAGDLEYHPCEDLTAELVDTRFNRRYDRLELTAIERRIYEYCDEPRTLAAVCAQVRREFPDAAIAEEEVGRFLERLVAGYFMVRAHDWYLSTAAVPTAPVREPVTPSAELAVLEPSRS